MVPLKIPALPLFKTPQANHFNYTRSTLKQNLEASSCFTTNFATSNSKRSREQQLKMMHENSCNFKIFMNQVRILVPDNYEYIKLADVMQQIAERTILGVNVFLIDYNNKLVSVNYVPILSSFLLVVKSDRNDDILKEIEFNKKVGKLNGLLARRREEELVIEFQDSKPFFERKCFMEVIEGLLADLDILGKVYMQEISKRSELSVTWVAGHCAGGDVPKTTFIVTYSLAESDGKLFPFNSLGYFKSLRIAKTYPLKFDEMYWMKQITPFGFYNRRIEDVLAEFNSPLNVSS